MIDSSQSTQSNFTRYLQDNCPIIQPLDSFESLLEWAPNQDDACVCKAPLAERRTSSKPFHPQTLICHDLSGGYLEDRFPEGICNPESVCYRFNQWHRTDIFVYFSHRFITVPPPSWVAAAHKHGVKILGTFITEWEAGAEIIKCVLKSENCMKRVVYQMTAIAQYYNFDGWLINIENKVEATDLEMLTKFVDLLRKESHKSISHSQVIWYDSVTNTGELDWQNALNKANSQFFDVSDGIFLNYTWTDENLLESKEFAVNCGRQFDVYVGVDVFGRGCKGGGGFNTDQAVKEIRKNQLSAALFAQAWAYQSLPKEEFLSNENRFWCMLKDLCPYRSLSQLPISSSFCQGTGEAYYQHGQDELKFIGIPVSKCNKMQQKISSTPWYNMGLQSFQPFCLLDAGGGNSEHDHNRVVSLCTETAFEGGSSLKVDGSISNQEDCLYISLFQTEIDISEVLLVAFTFKSLTLDTEVFLDISVEVGTSPKIYRLNSSKCMPCDTNNLFWINPVDSPERVLPSVTETVNHEEWRTVFFTIDKAAVLETMQSISLVLKRSSPGPVGILLGKIQVVPYSCCVQPLSLDFNRRFHKTELGHIQIGKNSQTGWLSWDLPEDMECQCFLIYASPNSPAELKNAAATEKCYLLGHSISSCFYMQLPGNVVSEQSEGLSCTEDTTVQTDELSENKQHVSCQHLKHTVIIQPVFSSGFIPKLSNCPMLEIHTS